MSKNDVNVYKQETSLYKLKNDLKSISRILCAVRFICASISTVLPYLYKIKWIPAIEHRERIVRAFEGEAEDHLLVTDTLGVNRSTARGIVARYIREGHIRKRPPSGRNNVLVDDEMRQYLKVIINENCVLTLSQINGELRRRLPAKPLIHDWIIARYLEGMLFRVKLFRPVPADINRRVILQRWQEYGNWFMNHAIMPTVFLLMSAVATSGLPEITGRRGRVSVHIDKYAASEDGT